MFRSYAPLIGFQLGFLAGVLVCAICLVISAR